MFVGIECRTRGIVVLEDGDGCTRIWFIRGPVCYLNHIYYRIPVRIVIIQRGYVGHREVSLGVVVDGAVQLLFSAV